FHGVDVTLEVKRDVDTREDGGYRFPPLALHVDLQVVNLLTLFFEDTHQIQRAARAECHQHQFHGPRTQPFAADFGRAVDVHLYIGRIAAAFKMDRVVDFT